MYACIHTYRSRCMIHLNTCIHIDMKIGDINITYKQWIHQYITFYYTHTHTHTHTHTQSHTDNHTHILIYIFDTSMTIYTYLYRYVIPLYTYIHPIADRVAQNLENISKSIQFGTRRTRILMGLINSTMLLTGTNRKSNGQNTGSLTQISKKSQDSVPFYL